jgi:hypothetical protein
MRYIVFIVSDFCWRDEIKEISNGCSSSVHHLMFCVQVWRCVCTVGWRQMTLVAWHLTNIRRGPSTVHVNWMLVGQIGGNCGRPTSLLSVEESNQLTGCKSGGCSLTVPAAVRSKFVVTLHRLTLLSLFTCMTMCSCSSIPRREFSTSQRQFDRRWQSDVSVRRSR